MKNHKIINKDIKIVNLEILKVKTWFGDKDYQKHIKIVNLEILKVKPWFGDKDLFS